MMHRSQKPEIVSINDFVHVLGIYFHPQVLAIGCLKWREIAKHEKYLHVLVLSGPIPYGFFSF